MIAGVDGCKAGWVAVIEEGFQRHIEVFGSFAELATREFSAVVVDIPIGLMTNTVRLVPSGKASTARRALNKRTGS